MYKTNKTLILIILIFIMNSCSEKIKYKYHEISYELTDSTVIQLGDILMSSQFEVVYTDSTETVFSDSKTGRMCFTDLSSGKIVKTENLYDIIDMEKESLHSEYNTCIRTDKDTFLLLFDNDNILIKVNPFKKTYNTINIYIDSIPNYYYISPLNKIRTFSNHFFVTLIANNKAYIAKINNFGKITLLPTQNNPNYDSNLTYYGAEYPTVSCSDKYLLEYYNYSFIIRCYDANSLNLMKEIQLKPAFAEYDLTISHPYKDPEKDRTWDKIHPYLSDNYAFLININIDKEIIYLYYATYFNHKQFLLVYNLENGEYLYDTDKLPPYHNFMVRNNQFYNIYIGGESGLDNNIYQYRYKLKI